MDMKVGELYEVVIHSHMRHGCKVQMSDGSTQFVHISQISNKYVKDIETMVPIGHQFTAKCITGKHGNIELSIKAALADFSDPKISAPEKSKLDKMIEACNKEYEDKFGGPRSKVKKRSRHCGHGKSKGGID